MTAPEPRDEKPKMVYGIPSLASQDNPPPALTRPPRGEAPRWRWELEGYTPARLLDPQGRVRARVYEFSNEERDGQLVDTLNAGEEALRAARRRKV